MFSDFTGYDGFFANCQSLEKPWFAAADLDPLRQQLEDREDEWNTEAEAARKVLRVFEEKRAQHQLPLAAFVLWRHGRRERKESMFATSVAQPLLQTRFGVQAVS